MKSMDKYIHYAEVVYKEYSEDEYVVKVNKTAYEATDLMNVGFECVTDVEGAKLFRKRKLN
jgi:hypothetical protein